MLEISALAALGSIGGPTSVADAGVPSQGLLASAQSAISAREPLQVVLEAPASVTQSESSGIADHLAAAADRWRAEFDAAQRRLSAPSGQSSALEAAMNRSLQLQAEIFRVSAGFHIGLSANQQSQGAVRTLIEKS